MVQPSQDGPRRPDLDWPPINIALFAIDGTPDLLRRALQGEPRGEAGFSFPWFFFCFFSFFFSLSPCFPAPTLGAPLGAAQDDNDNNNNINNNNNNNNNSNNNATARRHPAVHKKKPKKNLDDLSNNERNIAKRVRPKWRALLSGSRAPEGEEEEEEEEERGERETKNKTTTAMGKSMR